MRSPLSVASREMTFCAQRRTHNGQGPDVARHAIRVLAQAASRTPHACASPRAAALIGLAAVISAPAAAFTVEHSATRYADKRYHCELTVTLDAPIERVAVVLRDYEDYPELDQRILNARVIERPEEDVAVLATTLRACFGWFCRNVDRIERVQEEPRALTSTVDPARSDVTFGETRTELEELDDGTRVTYRTTIAPGFWIPPIVGRRWMLNMLEGATTNLFRNVEAKAKAPPAPSLTGEVGGQTGAENQ